MIGGARKRITSTQTFNLSGGGGSVIVTGNVIWGPNFGNNEAAAAWLTASLDSIPAIGLVGELDVTATEQMLVQVQALFQEFVNVSWDTMNLLEVNDQQVTGTLDGALQTLLDEFVNVKWDTENLIEIDTATVNVSGPTATVHSAPFWLNATFAGISNALGATSVSASFTGKPDPLGATGDLLLAFVCNNTTPAAMTVTTPSGWTAVRADDTNGALGIRSFWKLWAAGDNTATFTFTYSGTALLGVVSIHVIRGANLTTPINAQAGNTDSAVSPVAASVTTSVTNCMAFLGSSQGETGVAATYTPPAGFTERTDFSDGTATFDSTTTDTKVFAPTGATGAQTIVSSQVAASVFVTQTVAVAPGDFTI